jgi:hypothetical protein
MESKPCPSGKADYVLTSLDVERVDFVEEGGCQSCKVGVQPEGMILTAKISIKGEDSMSEEVVNETIQEEVTETVVDEVVPEESVETVEETTEVEEVIEEEEEEVVEVEEEKSELDTLKDEIASLREMLETKKAPVEAQTSEFDAEDPLCNLHGLLRPAFYGAEQFSPSDMLKYQEWEAHYRLSLRKETDTHVRRKLRMNAVNPAYVPRNYLAQQVIDAAQAGDNKPFKSLMDILEKPYEQTASADLIAGAKRPDWARHKAGCSMLSCSS